MKRLILVLAFVFAQGALAQVVDVDPVMPSNEGAALDLSDRNQCLLMMVDFATTLSFLPEDEASRILNGVDPTSFIDELFNTISSDINTFDHCLFVANAKEAQCVKMIRKGIDVFLKYNISEISLLPACEIYAQSK